MSYAAFVNTAGDAVGVYNANGMRFATEAEASAYGRDLSSRWSAMRVMEVRETDGPVNYEIRDGELRSL